MLLYTKQFCNAVRQVIKKHGAKIHTRYTFGTSGNTSMFSSFGKRKISYNCLGTKKQFNLIRKDLVKLFKGTWQQNYMKYNWYGASGSKTVEMNTSDERLLSNFRIEGTCMFKDTTQEQFDKFIEQKTNNILWGKLVDDTSTSVWFKTNNCYRNNILA